MDFVPAMVRMEKLKIGDAEEVVDVAVALEVDEGAKVVEFARAVERSEVWEPVVIVGEPLDMDVA